MNDIEYKINIIRKKYKKSNLFLEIFLLNYETFNIYIRIEYIKKLKVYKLNWFDLEVVNTKKIEKYMGSEYINNETIEYIANILSEKDNNYHVDSKKNTVILNAYFNGGYHYQFERFIPKDIMFLSEIFILIFNILPKKLDDFLYELQAEIMDTKSRYEYQDTFLFDLYNDNLNKIFNDKVIERGEKYYKDNKVCFLEKMDDKYYSVVIGTEKYLTVIKYNEKEKIMHVYCTCPCEFFCKHICAVICAIRDNKFKKFYKVIYINKEVNLLENITNNKYLLCSGIEDDCLEIINKYGEIELVPILDNEDNINFKVLEDDEKNTLTKEIRKLITF